MRLIDADVLDYDIIKYFPRAFESTEDIVAAWKKLVAEQPTAYDVDKVVSQLGEKAEAYDDPISSDPGFRRYCRGVSSGYRHSIDIVKAGGVDGQGIADSF